MNDILLQLGVGGIFGILTIKLVLDYLKSKEIKEVNNPTTLGMRKLRDLEILKLIGLSEDMQRRIIKLNEQHDNPEQTGFGTVGFKDLITSNTQAMQELTHYIIWLGKQNGHGEPPPSLKNR